MILMLYYLAGSAAGFEAGAFAGAVVGTGAGFEAASSTNFEPEFPLDVLNVDNKINTIKAPPKTHVDFSKNQLFLNSS